jgi:hypothetical protein
MRHLNDLDPTLQQFVDRATSGIAVPPLRRAAATLAGRRRAPVAAMIVAALAAVLLVTSGAAAATGLLSEVIRSRLDALPNSSVFYSGVSAVGSQATTLDGARVAQLPLPRSGQLTGGWEVRAVQLTMTEAWRSVELQYRRSIPTGVSGSRGQMSVGVWSEGITVVPTTDSTELATISGLPVTIGSTPGYRTARFTYQGATVIIRGYADEFGTADLSSLVEAWLAQTR